MKIILSKTELVLMLQQQLKDIEVLCREYDNGNESVASSIAEKIGLIFHGSLESKSLITQLKLGNIQIYCSSDQYEAKSPINFIGLLQLKHQQGKGWGYYAQLNPLVFTKVSLENWWKNKKVMVDSSGIAFSRSKITKALAGLEDINLDTSGWKIKDAGGNKFSINPLPEMIRQIAFELLESFKGVDFVEASRLYNKK
ncbi:MAG: hypothetical protein EOO95_15690 [Pedobacter sp.]|nr:MAG: hypothetical protein EOO95_15690 [Pedobacter sp.]